MKHVLTCGSLFFAVLALGCASSSELRTESSTSAIRTAEEVGATEVPRAALHLQLAKEEMARAVELAEKGDKDKAGSLLKRAEADAELAILLSREQTEKAEATQAMERVRKFQLDNR
jgi:hypothetical protein